MFSLSESFHIYGVYEHTKFSDKSNFKKSGVRLF